MGVSGRVRDRGLHPDRKWSLSPPWTGQGDMRVTGQEDMRITGQEEARESGGQGWLH